MASSVVLFAEELGGLTTSRPKWKCDQHSPACGAYIAVDGDLKITDTSNGLYFNLTDCKIRPKCIQAFVNWLTQ